jgi:hypothetical protein
VTARLYLAPLKTMTGLRFRTMMEEERETYPDVKDEFALIAYTDDETWIIDGKFLRIIYVDQKDTLAVETRFFLDDWATPLPALE